MRSPYPEPTVAGNQTIQSARQALATARAAGNPEREARALLDLGRGYAAAGLSVEAATAFESALDVARALGDRELAAQALANVGSQLHQAGQHDEALELSRQAVDAFAALGDVRGRLRTLANCAVIEQRLGSHGAALADVDTALTLSDELGEPILAVGLLALRADLCSALGQTAQADSSRRQAVQRARRLGDPTLLARQLEHLGESLLRTERYDEALRIYREAATLHRQEADVDGQYRVALQLALVHQLRVSWAEADVALTESLALCEQVADEPRRDYLRASLASARLELGRYDEAIDLAETAAAGYRRVADPIGEGRALATLGQALEASGAPERARAVWFQALDLLEPIDSSAADAVRGLLTS